MTVYRIKFGEIKLQKADEKGNPIDYVMRHTGKKDKILLKKKTGVAALEKQREKQEKGLNKQCRKAKEMMDEHALAEDKGPYADHNDEVEELSTIFNKDDRDELIDQIIDILAPFDLDARTESVFHRHYEYDDLKLAVIPDMIIPNEGLLTAGRILSEQEDRAGTHGKSGIEIMVIPNYMEAMMIAVSVIRKLGIDAYPSVGMATVDDQPVVSPLIAILEPEEEICLTTFNLFFRSHPPIEALDLISDVAMLGGTYALRAEYDGKMLASEMVASVEEKGERIPQDKIIEVLDALAGKLFEAHKRWEGSLMIIAAVNEITRCLYQAIRKNEENFVLLSTNNENILNDRSIQQVIESAALNKAGEYSEIMSHKLKLKIARDMAAKEKAEKDKEEKPTDSA